jgi:hypothetical protein
MVVRDEHGVDVGGRMPNPRQGRAEISPVARQPGVEHGETAALCEQIPVRVDALQTMDALGDLGQGQGHWSDSFRAISIALIIR